MTEEVSGPGRVGIGGILPPLPPGLTEERPNFSPGHGQQRPHERHAVAQPPSPPHATHTRKTRAPEDPVENCLGLVVGRVRHQHMPAATGVGDLGQKGIAEPPGPGLEPLATHGPIISDSQPSPVAWQPELRRKLDNERPVISRLSTEIVLRMGHQDGCLKHAAQAQKQANAVGTARHPHDHRAATRAARW